MICTLPQRQNVKYMLIRSNTKDHEVILRYIINEIKENGYSADRLLSSVEK